MSYVSEYLHEEDGDGVAEVCVDVVEILDDTLGPLQAVLGEGPLTVQHHHCGQVLKLVGLLSRHLNTTGAHCVCVYTEARRGNQVNMTVRFIEQIRVVYWSLLDIKAEICCVLLVSYLCHVTYLRHVT